MIKHISKMQGTLKSSPKAHDWALLIGQQRRILSFLSGYRRFVVNRSTLDLTVLMSYLIINLFA